MDQEQNKQQTQNQNENKPHGCCGGSECAPEARGDGQDKAVQFCMKLKQNWDRLTDEDLALANNDRGQLIDRISQTYGVSRNDAEQQLSGIERDCGMRAGDACGV